MSSEIIIDTINENIDDSTILYDKVKFQQCLKEEYDALTERDNRTLYFLSDTKEIYLGENLFASGRSATEDNDGLMTKEAMDLLQSISTEELLLRAKNNSIILTDYNGEKYIEVGLSDDNLNILSIDDSGLFAPKASYEILEQDPPEEGYAHTYYMQNVFDGDATIAGEKINIPPTNYDILSHKPSVNGVELEGDKTTSDLGIVIPQGTVTDVRVRATSPIQSSVNTEQTESLDTTISLADNYGDIKNPYASREQNQVLATPSTETGVPGFRHLVADDIPSLTVSKISDFPAEMTPSSHVHGDITNNGDIVETSTISEGDRLVINDESESKITNSSITFGDSTTTFLSNKGTWRTPDYPVRSVNGKTGNVSLSYLDVHALPDSTVVPPGTMTSVQVQATTPVKSSVSTEQTGSLNTTISLENGYGDIQNPYTYKTKNQVLAAPYTGNGVPSFRALVDEDIPNITTEKVSDFPDQFGNSGKFLRTNGSALSWGEVDFFPDQAGNSGKFLTTNGTETSWSTVNMPVVSVNGETGAVTLDYTDVGALSEHTIIPEASYSIPLVDGIASAGIEDAWSRGDHVHPTDATRQPKIMTSGILKGDGNGGISQAVADTDYQTPLPDQYGNNGKFLSTNGAAFSWSDTPMLKGVDFVTAGKASGVTLGTNATAEGFSNSAGNYAHAEGYQVVAAGSNSHAEGESTTANGLNSHAEGSHTTANTKSQHVFGEYNVLDIQGDASTRGKYIELVGNGTSSERSNARTLDWYGNETLAGKLTVGSSPTEGMDVTTKTYVDTAISNIDDLPSQDNNAGKFLTTDGTDASWVTITQDDHKWGNVTLQKDANTPTNNVYVPYILNTSATSALLIDALSNPTEDAIARYDHSRYLNSRTPSAGDSSTKVATTAFVGTAISNYDPLPSQTGNSGKFLTTDGTDTSWAEASDEIFVATYDVTTYDELYAAYSAGKSIVVDHTSGRYYFNTFEENVAGANIFVFSGIAGSTSGKVMTNTCITMVHDAGIPDYWNIVTIPSIPVLTNQGGKFLTTDGTDISWSDTPMVKGRDYVTAGKASGTSLGTRSTAEGYVTTASGQYSHAEGYSTTASGQYSHAEGWGADALGDYSHAEGGSTTKGWYSHAEGEGTLALGIGSHAEGRGGSYELNLSGNANATTYTVVSSNIPSELFSHMPNNCYAWDYSSKNLRKITSVTLNAAETAIASITLDGTLRSSSVTNWPFDAEFVNAIGGGSHSEGVRTIAKDLGSHAGGRNNIPVEGAEVIGGGTNEVPANIRVLDWSGNEWLAGKLTVSAGPTNNMDVATKQYVDTSIVSRSVVTLDVTTYPYIAQAMQTALSTAITGALSSYANEPFYYENEIANNSDLNSDMESMISFLTANDGLAIQLYINDAYQPITYRSSNGFISFRTKDYVLNNYSYDVDIEIIGIKTGNSITSVRYCIYGWTSTNIVSSS